MGTVGEDGGLGRVFIVKISAFNSFSGVVLMGGKEDFWRNRNRKINKPIACSEAKRLNVPRGPRYMNKMALILVTRLAAPDRSKLQAAEMDAAFRGNKSNT